MKVHSHVQVPKLILKSFCDENENQKRIWYLDIATGQIKKESKKILGTSVGYYSQDIEKFWNNTIEDSLGKLKTRIQNCVSSKNDIILWCEKDVQTIRRYFKSASVRSNLANKSFKENTKVSRVASQQELNDSLAEISMSQVNVFDDIIDSYYIGVLINQTEKSLVVPRNCYYAYYNDLIAPLSPDCAIILSQNEQIQNKIIAIDNSSEIDIMNIMALKYEFLFNEDFVATNNYDDLVYLRDILEQNRFMFEKMKKQTETTNE